MTDLIGETITKNKSAVNSASKTRNWIKASNKLCEIGGIFDAYGLKKDWYGKVQRIFMDDDGDVNIQIGIGNNNSVLGFNIKESLIDTVLDIPTESMVKFSGYFVKGNMSENECIDGGVTASPDMLNESFQFNFTDVALLLINRVGKDGKKEGEHLSYYENGQLKWEGNYKDGKLDGEWLHYYENGEVKEKSNYKDGTREGEESWYYENGQLKGKSNYKDGKEDGESSEYREDGQLKETVIYKNNKLERYVDYHYHENGQLKWKRNHKVFGKTRNDSKYDGEWLSYDETGELKKTEIYKDGKLEGTVISKYYKNGQLRFKGNTKDGKKEGEHLTYYENGQLRYKSTYKDGRNEGEWLVYFENGRLKFKTNYKDGKKEGEESWYYENGQLEKTEIYKNGKKIATERVVIKCEDKKYLDGGIEYEEECIYFASNDSQLKYKKNYKDGKKEGEWFSYMKNGQLKWIKNYKDGKLIETITP